MHIIKVKFDMMLIKAVNWWKYRRDL